MTASAPTVDAAGITAQLVRLLSVEAIGDDVYRGPRKRDGEGRVFGGQVIAQALRAAQATVEPKRQVHSIHAAFLRPGAETAPIDYRVRRDFDGGSFSLRNVVAEQDGRPILTLTASFQRIETGFTHADPVPDVPPPEELPGEAALLDHASRLAPRLRHWLSRPRAIELRPADPARWLDADTGIAAQATWFRVRSPLPDEPGLHHAVLAYASDMLLLGTAMLPHGMSLLDERMQAASLDHALWLHEPVRTDDWLLYATDSPWAGGGRGLCRGRIFTRDGRLVANVAQEGLIRHRV